MTWPTLKTLTNPDFTGETRPFEIMQFSSLIHKFTEGRRWCDTQTSYPEKRTLPVRPLPTNCERKDVESA